MKCRHTLVPLACGILFATRLSSVAIADPIKTAHGSIEGRTKASGIRVFRGIPFAAPPIGDLRWKPPQPATNWDGVRQGWNGCEHKTRSGASPWSCSHPRDNLAT